MDTSNRESLFADAASLITADQKYRFTWPTYPHDYVFKAGNQIGIVLVANYSGFSAINGTTGATVTLDTKTSKVSLPIVGGAAPRSPPVLSSRRRRRRRSPRRTSRPRPRTPPAATVAYPLPTATDSQDPAPVVTCTPPSGSQFAIGNTTINCTARDANGNTSTGSFVLTLALIVQDDGDVNGTVPGTLSLAVGGPASFGAFTPGLARDYLASIAATVTSTAGGALLTVTDPSATPPGTW